MSMTRKDYELIAKAMASAGGMAKIAKMDRAASLFTRHMSHILADADPALDRDWFAKLCREGAPGRVRETPVYEVDAGDFSEE